MKFNLITTLRSVGLTFIFVTTYFSANAYTITACFKVDTVPDISFLAGYKGNWRLLMSDVGTISDNFVFPDIDNFQGNTDYCLPPARVDDKYNSKILTNTLYLVDQDHVPMAHVVDPIMVPPFPAAVFNYCKLEFYGTFLDRHSLDFTDLNDYAFTVRLIDCHFPDSPTQN